MKRYSKVLLVLLMILTLCLGFAFAACEKTPQQPPQGGITDNPDNPDNPDKPDDPDKPHEPEPIVLGEFARVWYATGGAVLDLVNQTCEGLPDFKVTGITGERAETVITCTAAGNDYELKLNDGKLEMSDGTSTTAFYVFAPEFGGSWKLDDPYTGVYYTIASVPNEEGYVAWDMYGLYNGESEKSDGKAVTSFSFDEEGNVVVTLFEYNPVWEAYKLNVYYDDNGVLTLLDDYGKTYAITPFTGLFEKNAVYLDTEGNRIDLDTEAKTVEFNGVSAAYEIKATVLGGGLSFSVANQQYSLQKQLDRIVLVSESGVSVMSNYDPEAIKGAWSDSTGANTLEVTTDDKVSYNGTEYDLTAYSKNGDIYYDFEVGSAKYTIVPIKDSESNYVGAAFSLEKNGKHEDYYILDEAKQCFVGTFENGYEIFTVSADYKVTDATGDESFTAQGRFTYSVDLECIALLYDDPDVGLLYMVKVADEAIFWTMTAGDYLVYSSYFATELIPELEKLLAVGLESETDYYTTGGAEAQTLAFDFQTKTVIYNGESYGYIWTYELGAFGFYSAINFMTETEPYLYTVYASEMTAILTAFDTVSYEEQEALGATFISHEVYEEILGSEFIYRGAHYDERILFDKEGKLYVDTTDTASSDKAVIAVEYDYVLQRSLLNGKEDVIIAFDSGIGDLFIFVHIVERQHAMLFDIIYSRNDLVDYVGVYYHGTDTVELTAQGGVKVNGADVEVSSVTAADNAVTVVYLTDGNSVTAVLNGTTAAIGETTYTKRAFTPEAFVGTYTFDGKTVAISAATVSVNMAPTLTVKVDGTAVTAALAFTADGKQQLKFSCWVPGEMFPVLQEITATLDGDKLTFVGGSVTQEVTAVSWKYGDFIFTEKLTLTDSEGATHTFECIAKENGTLPLFLYDGETCNNFTVSIDGDGVKTLQVTCGTVALQIVVSADGAVTAGYKPSDIPLPPPPPPAPPIL